MIIACGNFFEKCIHLYCLAYWPSKLAIKKKKKYLLAYNHIFLIILIMIRNYDLKL